VSGKRYKKRQMVPTRQLDRTLDPQSPSTSIEARFQGEYFSGPIPPPNFLARYNEVVPNGAERIMAMAERQSAHREELEKQVVTGNLESQKQGNNRAFVLALVVILGGIYLMATGKSGWGFAAIITSLTSLVSVFAIARREQRKERVEKSTNLAQGRRR
jgi:uncharacterized membrane protein